MNDGRPLAVSVGDPSGIGPMVACTASLTALRQGLVPRIALFGDAERLRAQIVAAGGDAVEVSRDLEDIPEGGLGLVHVTDWSDTMLSTHAPTAAGGAAQLAALDAAIATVRQGQARAIVTGPTSKEAVTLSGVHFVGQTEHLAAAAGLAEDDVTMMFLGPRLKVALVTTHLAIAAVPAAITAQRVRRATVHLAEALCRLGEGPVRIRVAGLNPHAGEAGMFGNEEATAISPALDRLRTEGALQDRVEVLGPGPAEAVFRYASAAAGHRASGAGLEGVVAMFHDQATIASKLLDWGAAVNTTWGLPFVRTSVDHGVAYDAARAGAADDDGMLAALEMAVRLT